MGFDPGEIADYLGKSADDILAWEEGRDAPTYRQLERLAAKLKRPLSAFFLPTVPEPMPLPEDHRTLPDLVPDHYKPDTLYAFRAMANMLEEARELLDDLGYDLVYSLPTWSEHDSADSVAERIRQDLGVTIETQTEEMADHRKALDAWRSVLFDHGVLARVCRMPIGDVRAFCILGQDLAGIGLSNEDREHGRIFSLFHEVCHLGLRRPGASARATASAGGRDQQWQLERYCDRFAAAFLMPSSCEAVHTDLERLGRDFSLSSATKVANKFKVSKYVAARRALDLGYVDEAVYWPEINLWMGQDRERRATRTTRESGGDYNATQISHSGRRFVALVLNAVDAGLITSVEAGRLIGVGPSVVDTLR